MKARHIIGLLFLVLPAFAFAVSETEELSDEEAGKLVKHLFNYVNDKNPQTSDKLTKMCFIPIKQSLK